MNDLNAEKNNKKIVHSLQIEGKKGHILQFPCDAGQADETSIVKEAAAVLSHLLSVSLVAPVIVHSAAFITNELPQKEVLIGATEGSTSICMSACAHPGKVKPN